MTPLRAAEPTPPPPPVIIRQAAVKPVAAKPLPAAEPEAAAPAPVKAAASVKPVKPAPVAVAKATSAAPAAARPVSGGGTTAQVGAFSSQALAEKGWSDAAHAVPGGAAGRTRSFEEVSKDGKTYTRAYVGGFASHADALAFCSALKAKNMPCIVK